jgi:spore germination protein KB
VGKEAKQDAWIAVAITTAYGILLFKGYVYMLSMASGKGLFGALDEAYGKVLSRILAYGYVLYFLYIGARVLRDFCELITSAVFPNTPIEIIAISLILLCIYFVYHGIEVISRSVEIFFPYSAAFLALLVLFLLVNGSINLENLRPVLEYGWTPIFDSVFPSLMGFPFGEMIAFTVLISFVSRFDYSGKIGMAAVGTAGVILLLFTIINMSVLGADMNDRVVFPLLSAIREISIANFIERLDALVVFVMMLGIWLKVSVFFFAALKGMEFITAIPYRRFVFPMGMHIAFMTVFVAANFAEYIEEGLVFVPLYLHIPFQVGLPLVTTMILLVKGRRRMGAHKHEEAEGMGQSEK